MELFGVAVPFACWSYLLFWRFFYCFAWSQFHFNEMLFCSSVALLWWQLLENQKKAKIFGGFADGYWDTVLQKVLNRVLCDRYRRHYIKATIRRSKNTVPPVRRDINRELKQ